MEADIQQLRTAAEAAKLAAQTAATAAEKAAKVASDASVNAAVVNVNIEYIKKDIIEIKDTLKNAANNFIARPEHDDLVKLVNSQGIDVDTLKAKSNWFAGTLAVIGLVSALVIYIYITQQEVQNSNIDKIISQQK